MSKFLIRLCLKKMSMFSENIACYMEAISILATIKDFCSHKRQDLIFGMPTVLTMFDYTGFRKIGL